MIRNSTESYGLVSKLLHSLIAFSIIGLIGLGWWMVGLSYYDAWYHTGLELHRAIGICVLLLASIFVIWKVISPSPGLQKSLKPMEKVGAKVVHIILLLSMFVVPLTGYAISTSSGSGFTFFGLFDIPSIMAITDATRDLAISLHYYIAYGLIAVVLLHAGAAFKHQFIDKKGTLKRMF
ncbi:cytochrome b [Kiloniella majae]|uniref:cytochrome b n=1 Tax=Kiloniella majae TaxID=1938558 RepID=UPI000A278407|nr:cytochrome b [Kiloniella majae]